MRMQDTKINQGMSGSRFGILGEKNRNNVGNKSSIINVTGENKEGGAEMVETDELSKGTFQSGVSGKGTARKKGLAKGKKKVVINFNGPKIRTNVLKLITNLVSKSGSNGNPFEDG